MKSGDLVINTTQVGVAMNGLSHLVGVVSKAEFACALVRGLGGNLPMPTREKFAKEVWRCSESYKKALRTVLPFISHQVFHMTHEIPPDSRRLLDTYYDRNTGRLATYQLEVRVHSHTMCLLHFRVHCLCRMYHVYSTSLIYLPPVAG